MPNAADITDKELGAPRILLIGGSGSGKTTILRTLPRRTFVYAFDPNCIRSLKGASNIDYEVYLPDVLDLGVKPMASDKKQRERNLPTADTGRPEEPTAYINFEEHFEESIRSGYFDDFDNICFDSCTTFADIIMDRVQYLNGRLGKHPEQVDYTGAMATMLAVFRTLSAINKTVVATGHAEHFGKRAETENPMWQPVFVGKLRIRIPLLFSDTLRTEADQRGGRATYLLHTIGDPLNQYVRCSLDNVEPEIDVTLGSSRDPKVLETQGLGKLFNLGTQE